MPDALLAFLPLSAVLAFGGGYLLGRTRRVAPWPLHRHTWKTGEHRYGFGTPTGVRICTDPACARIEMQSEDKSTWFKIRSHELEHLQDTARRLIDPNA